jgi:hypothetical protein
MSALMDVSLDHETTLIEQGMGVHLNYPLTARQSICDSQHARWEAWIASPLLPAEGR